MVAVECRSPRSARTWKGQAPQTATGAASTKHSHCQFRNCRPGAIDSTSTGTASTAVTTSRSRSCFVALRLPLAAAVAVMLPPPGGIGQWAV